MAWRDRYGPDDRMDWRGLAGCVAAGIVTIAVVVGLVVIIRTL